MIPSTPQRYRITTPIPTATVPVLSQIDGTGKIIAHLPDNTEFAGMPFNAVWLTITLPNGTIGYVAQSSAQLAENSPLPKQVSPAPLVKQSQWRTLPVMGLVIVFYSGGGALTFFGLVLLTLFEQTCYYIGGQNTGCSGSSYPFTVTGLIMLLAGVGVMFVGWLVSRNARSQFRR
jgi:hypothetical protein